MRGRFSGLFVLRRKAERGTAVAGSSPPDTNRAAWSDIRSRKLARLRPRLRDDMSRRETGGKPQGIRRT